MARNRREKEKYPGLKPSMNLKRRRHLIDYDYLDKLTEEEKAWLNQFTEEYTGANFKKDVEPLHNTKILKQDCTRMNNKRNTDAYTIAQTTEALMSISGFEDIVSVDED